MLCYHIFSSKERKEICHMKYRKILSFSALLLPILLTSCNPTNPTSVVSTPKATDTGKPSTATPKPDVPKSDTGAGGGSGTTITSSTPNEEDDPDIIKPEDSPWTEEVTASMVQYLGGNILPYIDIGKSIDISYVSDDANDGYKSYLLLVGNKFVSSNLQDAKDTYISYDWGCMVVNSIFVANSDKIDIDVIVESNKDGLFELRAYWSEKFDDTSVSDWADEEKEDMSDYLGAFDIIPFIYLGTKNYKIDFSADATKVMTITGGTWNDQVCDIFQETFADPIWTVAQDPKDMSKYTATYTADNGSVLVATLGTYHNKAQVVVSLDEKFDNTNQDHWSKTVKDNIAKSLGGLTLPYIYLGTVSPEVDSYNTNSRKLYLKGKLWDDSLLTKAKETLEGDGWTEQVAEAEADDTAEETSKTFSKTVGINDYKAVIKKNIDGDPIFVVSRTEIFTPSSLTAWPDDLKTQFTAKYTDGMDEIPFVYIGTTTPYVDGSVDKYDPNFIICGGKYDAKTIELFDTAYDSDSGWTLIKDFDSSKDYSSRCLVQRIALKEINGNVYKVALFKDGEDDDETAYIEIAKSAVMPATTATDWSEGAKAVIKTLGENVSIPFFDTGSTEDEIKFTDGSLEFNLKFSFDNIESFMLNTKAAFDTAGWDTQLTMCTSLYSHDEAYIKGLYATKAFDDGRTLKISFKYSNSSYSPSISNTISFDETYDEDNAPTAWTSEITNALHTAYGEDFDLPYLYLGTKHPMYTYDAKTRKFDIYGSAYDRNIFTNAKVAFSSDKGFVYDSNRSFTTSLYFTYKLANKDILTLYITQDYSTKIPYIEITYQEGFIPENGKEWTAEIKTAFSQEFGSESAIPYIYLGTVLPSVATKTIGTSVNVITITGSDWNNDVLELAKAKLDADTADGGWHADYCSVSSSYTTSKDCMGGYKMLSDGSQIRVLARKVSSKITMSVYHDLAVSNLSTTPSTWASLTKANASNNEDIVYQMNYLFQNHAVDPFIYLPPTGLGEDMGVYAPSDLINWNRKLRLYTRDTVFSPLYVNKAVEALEAAGFETTYSPFGYYTYPSVVATKTNPDGSYFKITYQSNYSSESSDDNGIEATIFYLPGFSSVTRTDWHTNVKQRMTNDLNFDVPYFNMGVDEPYTIYSSSSNQLVVTGYNYGGDSEIAAAKTAFDAAGWNTFETYIVSNDVVYKSLTGYCEKNGRICTVDIEPNIGTEIKVAMTLTAFDKA